MQILMRFYEGQLKQQMLNTLLISYMVFDPFKMAIQFFRLYQIIPISVVQMLFPKFNGPGAPDFRKVGKYLLLIYHSHVIVPSFFYPVIQ